MAFIEATRRSKHFYEIADFDKQKIDVPAAAGDDYPYFTDNKA